MFEQREKKLIMPIGLQCISIVLPVSFFPSYVRAISDSKIYGSENCCFSPFVLFHFISVPSGYLRKSCSSLIKVDEKGKISTLCVTYESFTKYRKKSTPLSKYELLFQLKSEKQLDIVNSDNALHDYSKKKPNTCVNLKSKIPFIIFTRRQIKNCLSNHKVATFLLLVNFSFIGTKISTVNIYFPD